MKKLILFIALLALSASCKNHSSKPDSSMVPSLRLTSGALLRARPLFMLTSMQLGVSDRRLVMAKLTKKKRDALPDSAFAGPNRTYPINDKEHARFAAGLAGMHGASSKIKESIKKKAAKKGVTVKGKR